jgi:dynein heavy chain
LEERDAVMEIFLTYGRILTPDEVDKIGSEDKDVVPPKPCAPKMEGFREQIDHYENLFMDIEDMEPYKVFNYWFQVNMFSLCYVYHSNLRHDIYFSYTFRLQVDVRPFRQALLNTVRKWGNMYKEHLVNNVTSSLSDLGNFIREADEGKSMLLIATNWY